MSAGGITRSIGEFLLGHPYDTGGFLCENVYIIYGGLVRWFFVRKCGNMK